MLITGIAGDIADVNSSNELTVSAVTATPLAAAAKLGDAYSWASETYDPDAADTLLMVKNTSSSLLLYITHVWLSCDVETRWHLHTSSTNVTIAGTTITGVNLLATSAKVATADAARDETGNTQGDMIWSGETQATQEPLLIPLEGAVILGLNCNIGADIVAAATAGDATFIGYFA